MGQTRKTFAILLLVLLYAMMAFFTLSSGCARFFSNLFRKGGS